MKIIIDNNKVIKSDELVFEAAITNIDAKYLKIKSIYSQNFPLLNIRSYLDKKLLIVHGLNLTRS